MMKEYIACGVTNDYYGVHCIRPAGHSGKHSGTQMVPQRVWWSPVPKTTRVVIDIGKYTTEKNEE